MHVNGRGADARGVERGGSIRGGRWPILIQVKA
jgi:hypothetical protein